MTELERLVVLIAIAMLKGKPLGDEALALLEVVNARAESARGYQYTTRGIDALERVRARAEQRDVDYPAARNAAAAILELGEGKIDDLEEEGTNAIQVSRGRAAIEDLEGTTTRKRKR